MQKPNGAVRTAKLTTSATLICGQSERRVALLFSPHALKIYTLSTEPGVALGAGIVMTPSSAALEISVARFGDAAQRAWYGVAEEAITIGLLEVVGP